mmetsp:Transcript_101631/g.288004  ORF Transcript_101631/g.288004 Transcript_101631/m.288004 type:complete len:264 (+) Transcript_101631:592-1383(+)
MALRTLSSRIFFSSGSCARQLAACSPSAPILSCCWSTAVRSHSRSFCWLSIFSSSSCIWPSPSAFASTRALLRMATSWSTALATRSRSASPTAPSGAARPSPAPPPPAVPAAAASQGCSLSRTFCLISWALGSAISSTAPLAAAAACCAAMAPVRAALSLSVAARSLDRSASTVARRSSASSSSGGGRGRELGTAPPATAAARFGSSDILFAPTAEAAPAPFITCAARLNPVAPAAVTGAGDGQPPPPPPSPPRARRISASRS